MKHFAVVDYRFPEDSMRKLAYLGIDAIKIPPCKQLAPPIDGHPDMQIFIQKGTAFCHKNIDQKFLHRLKNFCNVTVTPIELGSKYPDDIPFNISITGKYAIHKKGSTPPQIERHLTDLGFEFLYSPQGYAKCSTLTIDEKSIITADKSIHKIATESGIDVLLIKEGFWKLPGYNYGFIGGSSGIFEDLIIFTGKFEKHPDFNAIKEFINLKQKKIFYLSEDVATDYGSLLIFPIE